ncbi:MAG: 3-isopropylmalate dehydrogenase, partial [Rhodoferax sp.]|nr:3-isopropylmalate dehydrogenase [Rhodoferax sp.]
KKSQPVPIVLFGSAYWKRLINIDAMVEEGVIAPEDLELLHYVDDPQDAWDIIAQFYRL